MSRPRLIPPKLHHSAALAAAVAALATIGAVPAAAQTCKAPPGMSAIDQYCEAVPGPAGERGRGDPDRGGRPVPAAARRALARTDEGRAILALSAAETERTAETRLGGVPGGPAARDRAAASERRGVLDAVTSGISDGPGTGPLLGAIMLALATGFLGGAWLRYRGGRAGGRAGA